MRGRQGSRRDGQAESRGNARVERVAREVDEAKRRGVNAHSRLPSLWFGFNLR